MKIIGQTIYNSRQEKVSIDAVNRGLSLLCGQPVKVDDSNLHIFEGDILALCFGFHQPTFKCTYADGTTKTDESNNMREAYFHFSQHGEIVKIKQLN